MITMTEQELTELLVSQVEAKPENTDGCTTYTGGSVLLSPKKQWRYHIRTRTWRYMPSDGKPLRPTKSVDDCIKCVEAAGYKWTKMDYSTNSNFMSVHFSDGRGLLGRHDYTDDNHAMALALAAAQAIKGEMAEVVG